MAFRFFAAAITSIALSTSAFAQETKSVPLKTKVDSELKSIVETIVNSLLVRSSIAGKDSKIVIDENSQVASGEIVGQYAIVPKEGAVAAVTTQGTVKLTLSEAGENVNVDTSLSGEMSAENIIVILTAMNASICSVAGASCASTELLSVEEMAATPSKKSAIAFEKIKANIVSTLTSLSKNSGTEKKKKSFGQKIWGGEEKTKISAETTQQLVNFVQSAVTVTQQEGSSQISMDMGQLKSTQADVVGIYPSLSLIFSFHKIEMQVTDSVATYTLTSQNNIPARAVQVYDEYLSQSQAKEGGLTELATLVGKIGPWAVRQCSKEKYQGLCVDKLFNSCARDVAHVDGCIAQARSLETAVNKEGSTWDSINGAFDLGVAEGATRVTDGATDAYNAGKEKVDGVINYIFGTEEDPNKKP